MDAGALATEALRWVVKQYSRADLVISASATPSPTTAIQIGEPKTNGADEFATAQNMASHHPTAVPRSSNSAVAIAKPRLTNSSA
jgi:hypothetical protein